MADEISPSGRLTVVKSSIDDEIVIPSTKIDMSGTERIDTVISIGTSEEALPMGDVATPGLCYLENLDATNYVSLRAATGLANTLEFGPGEGFFFKLARTATAPYAVADTAACRIRWVCWEA